MAALLSPPPPASRSHRAQPARLRRAPRASRVAFGSAERGCAPPPAQTLPNAPASNPRSRSCAGDGCFAFPVVPCKPQAGGLRPPPAQTLPNHPSKSPRTNLPKPSPKIPPHKPSQTLPKTFPLPPKKKQKNRCPKQEHPFFFAYYIDGGPSHPLFRKTTTE